MLTIADFLAKSAPVQSIPTHSIVSGLTAQGLLQKYVSEGVFEQMNRLLNWSSDETSRFIGYFVALHDIGKLAPHFAWSIASEGLRQKLEAEGLNPAIKSPVCKYRHEKTTQFILYPIWTESGCDRKTARFLTGILGGHHQGKAGETESPASRWEPHHRALERQMREFFYGETALRFPTIHNQDRGFLGAILLAITILADWIASGGYFKDAEQWMTQGTIRLQAEEKIAAFLQESGLSRQSVFTGETFCDVWPNIPADGVRPLQRETERIFLQAGERISLVLLEAPMGEGKTEAGLYSALQMVRQWKKTGIYMGLPTAATANQMVSRMRELFALHNREEPVRLLHAMAWLVDQQTPENPEIDTEDVSIARRWLMPLRRGLLSSYAVGTVDQVMLSAMLIKYGVLRLLGLSGKALVIDELHAYDVYMSEILVCLLQWCRALEIPVVLLSATLPPEKKGQLISSVSEENRAYPAITAVTESGRLLVHPVSETTRRQRVNIVMEPILHAPQRIAWRAIQLVENGGCACVLMNTVRQAQEVFQCLQEAETETQLLLFHARFPAGRRDQIEKECLRLFGKDKTHRPRRAILVATQVVEQSLDIDMDVMLTAIAPVDLLLQRTGRMFRHDNTPRPDGMDGPVLHVLVPEDDNMAADGFVYPECLLRQSIHLLENRNDIRIPEDIAGLVADGYDMEKAPQKELDAWLERLMEDQISAGRREFYSLGNPEGAFRPIQDPDQIVFDDLERDGFLSAKTRLGEPTERIALVEMDLFRQIEQLAEQRQDRRYAPVVSKTLAREVLEQSVSARKKNLQGFQGICGERLLEGVRIFPAEQGVYTAPDGRMICFDPLLGLIWKDGGAS